MTFITNIMMLASRYCPVVLLERYISMFNIEPSNSDPPFRPLRLFKSTNSCTLCGVKLSYTRCREIKECPKEIGVDHNLYGLYSLQSGGATPAVRYDPNPKKEHLTLSLPRGSPLTSKVAWR